MMVQIDAWREGFLTLPLIGVSFTFNSDRVREAEKNGICLVARPLRGGGGGGGGPGH